MLARSLLLLLLLFMLARKHNESGGASCTGRRRRDSECRPRQMVAIAAWFPSAVREANAPYAAWFRVPFEANGPHHAIIQRKHFSHPGALGMKKLAHNERKSHTLSLLDTCGSGCGSIQVVLSLSTIQFVQYYCIMFW